MNGDPVAITTSPPVPGVSHRVLRHPVFTIIWLSVEAAVTRRGLEELAGSARQVTLRGRLYKKPPGKQKSKSIGPLRFEILEALRKD